MAEVQGDSYRSSLRNKRVAAGFYLVNAIEKYGSGFIRIRKALQDYPEVQFDIAEKFGGVMATFSLLPESSPEALGVGMNEGVNGGVSEGVNGGVSEGVNGGVNDLIQLIKKHPGLRANALAARLSTSVKNVERWLKQLKDQSHIEFRGAPKTGGYHPTTKT